MRVEAAFPVDLAHKQVCRYTGVDGILPRYGNIRADLLACCICPPSLHEKFAAGKYRTKAARGERWHDQYAYQDNQRFVFAHYGSIYP